MNEANTNHSDTVSNFLKIFPIMSKCERRIMFTLHSFATSPFCSHVYPSVKTIAKLSRCSEASVKRATAKFQRLGFLYKIKRGYQSNVYLLADDIIKLPIKNERIYLEKCAHNDPVLETTSSNSNIPLRNKGVMNNKNFNNRQIPESLDKARISQEDKQWIANRFDQCVIEEAVENARWYLRQGNKIRNLTAFLISRCQFYESQRKCA